MLGDNLEETGEEVFMHIYRYIAESYLSYNQVEYNELHCKDVCKEESFLFLMTFLDLSGVVD